MSEQFDGPDAVLFSYDPAATYTTRHTVTLEVTPAEGHEPHPVTLTGSVLCAADGVWVRAQLWNTEDRYIGMLAPVLRVDSTPARVTVAGYAITIDRITTRHALLSSALTYLAEHAGLLLPGLQALEDAFLRASRDERAGLRRVVNGVTQGDEASRQRWAQHAHVLSLQSRLFPDRNTTT